MTFNSYSIWGLVSSLGFLAAMYGLIVQIIEVRTRQVAGHKNSSLSFNRVLTSCLSFHASLLIGLSISNLEYFLAITRTLASILSCILLILVWIERKTILTSALLASTVILIASTLLFWIIDRSWLIGLTDYANVYLFLTIIGLWQGHFHQYLKLKSQSDNEGVSKFYYQMLLAKDASGLIFALHIGFDKAWALIISHLILIIFEVLNLKILKQKSC